LERKWPPALKESGAWPLSSLRQSFLNGALTRLVDPDAILRTKIVEFVGKGELGLASGQRADGTYDRVWFGEWVTADEVAFEPGVFLLAKTKAQALKTGQVVQLPDAMPGRGSPPLAPTAVGPQPVPAVGGGTAPPARGQETKTLRLVGSIPPEVWNRLGTKLLPKLRTGAGLKVGVEFTVTVAAPATAHLEQELRQVIDDLGLGGTVKVTA
jgi:hypothetical protein